MRRFLRESFCFWIPCYKPVLRHNNDLRFQYGRFLCNSDKAICEDSWLWGSWGVCQYAWHACRHLGCRTHLPLHLPNMDGPLRRSENLPVGQSQVVYVHLVLVHWLPYTPLPSLRLSLDVNEPWWKRPLWILQVLAWRDHYRRYSAHLFCDWACMDIWYHIRKRQRRLCLHADRAHINRLLLPLPGLSDCIRN